MNWEQKLEKIKQIFGEQLKLVEVDRGQCPILWIDKSSSIKFLSYIKNESGLKYEFLSDLTAYDDLDQPEEKEGRFVVVYNLFSLEFLHRIRVKVRVSDGESLATAVLLWKAANWAEREVWDMYGISFAGHPDLRRIMMDQRFVGHPQRKDYYWRQYQLFNDAEPIPEHLLKD